MTTMLWASWTRFRTHTERDLYHEVKQSRHASEQGCKISQSNGRIIGCTGRGEAWRSGVAAACGRGLRRRKKNSR